MLLDSSILPESSIRQCLADAGQLPESALLPRRPGLEMVTDPSPSFCLGLPSAVPSVNEKKPSAMRDYKYGIYGNNQPSFSVTCAQATSFSGLMSCLWVRKSPAGALSTFLLALEKCRDCLSPGNKGLIS